MCHWSFQIFSSASQLLMLELSWNHLLQTQHQHQHQWVWEWSLWWVVWLHWVACHTIQCVCVCVHNPNILCSEWNPHNNCSLTIIIWFWCTFTFCCWLCWIVEMENSNVVWFLFNPISSSFEMLAFFRKCRLHSCACCYCACFINKVPCCKIVNFLNPNNIYLLSFLWSLQFALLNWILHPFHHLLECCMS